VLRLEQFDRIAVGILHLDLFPARAYLHLIAETEPCLIQDLDHGWQVFHLQDDAVPSAGFLLPSARHRAGARSTWTAQENPQLSERNVGELRQVLMLQLEPEGPGVELDGTSDVANVIPDPVKAFDEALRRFMRFFAWCHGFLHCVSRTPYDFQPLTSWKKLT
jgi:hypothetical protein